MAVTSMANSSIGNFNKSNNVSNSKGALGSGGTVTDYNGYRYHTFTTSGTFVANRSGDFECLIIAGGGAGGGAAGREAGGGGGAGGIFFAPKVLDAGSYSVTVGAGGAATTNQDGGDGGDSSIAAVGTATGGGGGGGADPGKDGRTGGSGGGAWGNDASNTNRVGGAPVDSIGDDLYWGQAWGLQGTEGGAGNSIDSNGGNGGGGGGAAFIGRQNAVAGVGTRQFTDWGLATSTGDSVTSGSNTQVFYAGGGNGSIGRSGGSLLEVPFGGGGQGTHYDSNNDATAGQDACGAGGGAASRGRAPADGGDGVVIVRYAL